MTMKTRWMVSLVLVFPLLAGFSIHEPAAQTALAEEAASEELIPEPMTETDLKSSRTCPIIPIEVYGSDTLYQALYYENENCPPPTFTYVFGTYQYPQTCPDCDAKKGKSPQKFYGLAMPAPADYDHKMPAGKPYSYSRKALTPNRIEYLYLKTKGVYVKVFARDVNRVDMKSGAPADPLNFKETIYFAFECSDPASIGVNVAEIEAIHESKQRPVPDPGGAPTTVYDVTYDYAGGQTHILTFLVGDPEPPEYLKSTDAVTQ